MLAQRQTELPNMRGHRGRDRADRQVTAGSVTVCLSGMSYQEIDEVINAWAADLRVTVHKEYNEVEVRSTDIVSFSGAKCQIWIDPPNDGLVGVHVWNYKDKRTDTFVPVSQLRDTLKNAYATAHSWLSR